MLSIYSVNICVLVVYFRCSLFFPIFHHGTPKIQKKTLKTRVIVTSSVCKISSFFIFYSFCVKLNCNSFEELLYVSILLKTIFLNDVENLDKIPLFFHYKNLKFCKSESLFAYFYTRSTHGEKNPKNQLIMQKIVISLLKNFLFTRKETLIDQDVLLDLHRSVNIKYIVSRQYL